MSAIGSVIMVVRSESPARFRHAGNLAPQRALAEADAAHREPPHVCARPTAQATAIVLLRAELRRAQRLRNHGLLGHGTSLLLSRATLPAGTACPAAPAVGAPPRRCA